MHIPVLYQETIAYLQPRPGAIFIDGTVGAGGHTRGLLEATAPGGKILAFDRDPEAINYAREQLAEYGDRVTFVNARYSDMGELAPVLGFDQVDGILLDLGLSSRQLADDRRGFSFRSGGPLDMRFDPSSGPTAADLVNELSVPELEEILRRFGEVPRSKRLAQAIVNARPIYTTNQLVELIVHVLDSPGSRRTKRGDSWDKVRLSRRIHPATQVFQALRIAVNNELTELERGLAAALLLLKPGGRLVIISFHSLEDRLVKQFIREKSLECQCPPEQPICTCDVRPLLRPITRKVIRPSDKEIANNPRSRSAKLRAAEKMAGEES